MHQRSRRSRRLFGRLLFAVWAPALAAVLVVALLTPTPGARDRSAHPQRHALSLVSEAPVAPKVHEFPLTNLTRSRGQAMAALARTPAGSRLLGISDAEPVHGFATVGLTWAHGENPPENALTVSVRTRVGGVWSPWQPMPYEAGHGPDPNSPEGQNALPGTDAVVIGDTDAVQVKVESTGPAVHDMRLAVVDPGRASHTVRAQPAIDTAALGAADGLQPVASGPGVTPKPKIFSRAQWGADESLRDKSSLRYYEVHAGFVHHTVNANGYTRSEVPSIIRGIYAYHVKSRGWSDIGYNFLIDRFGRIWEGRYGGVDRPVVGAHTLGYNDYSFGASAIGNYQQVKPSRKMVHAYADLFAWKLSLHGVDAASTRQKVGGDYFQAINGHRDAGQTACPGQYLYNRLPRIRKLAADDQRSWASRERQTDLNGDGWPDIVARNAEDQQMYILPTGGQRAYLPPVKVLDGWQTRDLIVTPGDVNGDKIPDLLGRDRATRITAVLPGRSDGTFGDPIRQLRRFRGVDLLYGVGDWNHDGVNDVVGRNRSTGELRLFRGIGNGRFEKAVTIKHDVSSYDRIVGKGDFNGDNRLDLVMAAPDGTLWVLERRAHLRVGTAVQLGGDWSGFDLVTATTDVNLDGHPDVFAADSTTGQAWLYPSDGNLGLGRRIGPFNFAQGADTMLVAGDLMGTRHADLLLRDQAGNISVVPDSGKRNLLAPVATGIDLSRANLVLNVGDFNGDGFGDVLTRNASSGYLRLRPGNGDGTFGSSVLVGKGFNRVRLLVAVGDVTGDGVPDLMGQPRGKAMRIYPGNGKDGFLRSYVAHSAIRGNRQVGFGLFDSDGAPDSLFRRNGNLVLYRGNGPGGLITGGKELGNAGRYDWILGSGDVNGDGRADLLVRAAATGVLWYVPRTPDGFAKRRFVGGGFGVYDLAG